MIDERYKAIIDLMDYKAKNHEEMSIENRAAQFSPFAALEGYGEKIDDLSRDIILEKEKSEDLEILLSKKINFLNDNLNIKPEIEVLYFKPDLEYMGGEYINHIGRLRFIDFTTKNLIFDDNFKISFYSIYDIKGNIFNTFL